MQVRRQNREGARLGLDHITVFHENQSSQSDANNLLCVLCLTVKQKCRGRVFNTTSSTSFTVVSHIHSTNYF